MAKVDYQDIAAQVTTLAKSLLGQHVQQGLQDAKVFVKEQQDDLEGLVEARAARKADPTGQKGISEAGYQEGLNQVRIDAKMEAITGWSSQAKIDSLTSGLVDIAVKAAEAAIP